MTTKFTFAFLNMQILMYMQIHFLATCAIVTDSEQR